MAVNKDGVYIAEDRDFQLINNYWIYKGTPLEVDITDFVNSKNLTSISVMFDGRSTYEATAVKRVVLGKNSVTSMRSTFHTSQATTLDLSSFDTSNVTDMRWMFQSSQATSLDLSSFDTSSVTNMYAMFQDSQATTGYARTQADANKFNSSSNKPAKLVFVAVAKPPSFGTLDNLEIKSMFYKDSNGLIKKVQTLKYKDNLGNITEDWIIEEIDGQYYDLGAGSDKMTVEFSVPRDTQIYMETMNTRPAFQTPVLEDDLLSVIFFRNSDRVIAETRNKDKTEYVLGSKHSTGLYHGVESSTSSSTESEYFESAILIGEYEEGDSSKNHISIKTSNIIELTTGDTWRMLITCDTPGTTMYGPTIVIRDVKDDRVLATYSFHLRPPLCYLTTCMVHYYGKSDDGVELTSMRKLREKYKQKHKKMLEEYSVISRHIILGIEKTGNEDYWYGEIKKVVDKIVIWVSNEEWEKAEIAYLNLYLELKDVFYSEVM